jgi:hypothetical protein
MEEVETKLRVTGLGSTSEFGTPNVEKRFTLVGAISSPSLGNAFELKHNHSSTIPLCPRPSWTRPISLMHQEEHKSSPHENIIFQGKIFSTFSPNIVVSILLFNYYKVCFLALNFNSSSSLFQFCFSTILISFINMMN